MAAQSSRLNAWIATPSYGFFVTFRGNKQYKIAAGICAYIFRRTIYNNCRFYINHKREPTWVMGYKQAQAWMFIYLSPMSLVHCYGQGHSFCSMRFNMILNQIWPTHINMTVLIPGLELDLLGTLALLVWHTNDSTKCSRQCYYPVRLQHM